MPDKLYEKSKDLFLRARDLPKEKREAFVRVQAAGDLALLNEVLSLLAHDADQTILQVDDATVSKPGVVDPLGLENMRKNTASNPLLKLIFSSKGSTGSAFLLIALLIAILGYLAGQKTRDELAGIRAEETRTILQSNVEALRFWIEDYTSLTEMALEDDEVISTISDLLESGSKKNLVRIDSMIKPFLEHADAISYIITDLQGTTIAAQDTGRVGQRVQPKYGSLIFEVAEGKPKFVLPFYPQVYSKKKEISPFPIVWMQVPVFDANNKVIATFGMGRRADQDFTRILRTARMGSSGETYAIDKDGWFISESRYEDKMRELDLLPDDTTKSSIMNLQARGYNFEISKDLRTLTPLAALVVAAQESNSPVTEGVVIKPSIDYKGDEVIGAWAWLPQYNFGLITQINAKEAFSPLRNLYIVIGIAILLLLIAAGYSFYTGLQLESVKTQLGSAIQMGQYQIERLIGEGGMGSVYLARHQLLKRPTAIKVIKLDKTTPDAQKRFEQEVKLASQLSHPNTIEVFDYGITRKKQAYCAMEYLHGHSLAEVVQKSGALPPARVVHIMQQVCGSLYEAHTLGLIHRDIKPQNIILLNKVGLPDFVKVLDFGLAKPLDQQSGVEETRTITGTPVYISPERLKRPGLSQPAADIYAVGAVMYFLLSGQPIFSYSSDLDIMYQILNDPPKPLPDDVPESLARLTFFCLEKDPDDRPNDMGEIKAFLDQLAVELSWTELEAQTWWNKYGN